MRAVNLLPRDAPAKSFEAKRGVVFLTGGGATLVTVALVALMLGASGAASQERQTLDLVNAQLLATPKPASPGEGEAGDDSALVAAKAARISALSTALSGRVAWDGILRQISQVLPEEVWLSSLSSGEGTTGGATRLTLNGSTYSQDGVARFLSRISVLPALTNVQLQSSAIDPSTTSGVVQFIILADVKPAGTGGSS